MPTTIEVEEHSQLLECVQTESKQPRHSDNKVSFETNVTDNFVESQSPLLVRKRPDIPWRGLTMAIALLIVGVSLISVGSLILSGYIAFAHMDTISPHAVIVIGLFCIIPGVYHVGYTINAFRGVAGYNFEDIPNFE